MDSRLRGKFHIGCCLQWALLLFENGSRMLEHSLNRRKLYRNYIHTQFSTCFINIGLATATFLFFRVSIRTLTVWSSIGKAEHIAVIQTFSGYVHFSQRGETQTTRKRKAPSVSRFRSTNNKLKIQSKSNYKINKRSI